MQRRASHGRALQGNLRARWDGCCGFSSSCAPPDHDDQVFRCLTKVFCVLIGGLQGRGSGGQEGRPPSREQRRARQRMEAIGPSVPLVSSHGRPATSTLVGPCGCCGILVVCKCRIALCWLTTLIFAPFCPGRQGPLGLGGLFMGRPFILSYGVSPRALSAAAHHNPQGPLVGPGGHLVASGNLVETVELCEL